MRENPDKDDLIKGVLFLLLLLLLLNQLPSVFSKDGYVDVNNDSSYSLNYDTLTSFNRITLGMPVSVNHADAESLTAVPGIGPKMAQRIIQERNQRGGFEYLYELQTVFGIGPVLYDKIRDYLIL